MPAAAIVSKLGRCFLLLVTLTDMARAADSRGEFLRLIGRPLVPLAPEVTTTAEVNGLAEERFSFAADARQRVAGVLVKGLKATGRYPVVISLHGTGGTKSDQLPFLREMARRGFIGVAIDGRYHGERTQAGKGSAEYEEAIAKAWRGSGEHPFFFDTAWDVMRLIDYLETRTDVDAQRIGLTGISKGGIETYLTAAVDPRVAVAVPCIGVQSFGWAVENDAWQSRISTIRKAFDAAANEAEVKTPDAAFVRRFYDRVAPEIYGKFDGPAMLPLIAPRPLLVINGDSDDRTPLPGLKECTDAALGAYRAAGIEDRFRVRLQEKTGHKVTAESFTAAAEWFERWLRTLP